MSALNDLTTKVDALEALVSNEVLPALGDREQGDTDLEAQVSRVDTITSTLSSALQSRQGGGTASSPDAGSVAATETAEPEQVEPATPTGF